MTSAALERHWDCRTYPTGPQKGYPILKLDCDSIDGLPTLDLQPAKWLSAAAATTLQFNWRQLKVHAVALHQRPRQQFIVPASEKRTSQRTAPRPQQVPVLHGLLRQQQTAGVCRAGRQNQAKGGSEETEHAEDVPQAVRTGCRGGQQ